MHRGETLGIVGESGCGKSTLARCLVRLLEPDGGAIRFEGRDISTLRSAERRAFNNRVQMIFQDPYSSLNPRMTVSQVLKEALSGASHAAEKGYSGSRYRASRSRATAADAASRYPHEFSGGQRQRIGIARALAVEPEVIVADELVSALDVSVQAQVINLLLRLQKELHFTLIFVAHDLRLVRHISHRVAVMYLGQDNGDRAIRGAVCRAAPPVLKGASRGRPKARPCAADTRRGRAWRVAKSARASKRLPVQQPLPICLRSLLRRTACSHSARTGTLRCLPYE